ncbi:MAG: FAD-dependent oxidoreductase [Enhydrobacter sp.]|nr:FAD-dependent oxidoreductase [Enhydrobacter sp.]
MVATGELSNVVLVGAGHAHVEVLRSFAQDPPRGIRLILVTRTRQAYYSGMLPGLIAGLYRPDETTIDSRRLAHAAGAEIVEANADGLDLRAQLLRCAGQPPIPYDVLSFDIGSTTDISGISGAGEHTVPVRPIDGFLERFEALRRRVLSATGTTRIAIVGGGAAGVELALSVANRLRDEAKGAAGRGDRLQFVLVCGTSELLPDFPPSFRRRFRTVLKETGIELVTGAIASAVEAGRLIIDGKPPVAADEILWAIGAAAPPWLRKTDLPLDRRGFISVDAELRVLNLENVFAAGDVASFTPRPLAKSGVYAVRQGPVIDRNIRSLLAGEPLVRYRPQRNTLYLVSTGKRHAIGTRNGIVVPGRWVWHVKDWIDRRWIGRYKAVGGSTGE